MCAHSRPLHQPQDALANRALDRRSLLRNTNMCTETSLSDKHAAPRSPRHLSPQIVGVSPAAPDTPWHRWYSSPGGFPPQITTCPQRLFVSTLHNVSVPRGALWQTEVLETDPPPFSLSAHFVAAACGPYDWIPAGDATSMPPCRTDARLVRLPSYSDLRPARAMCAVRWRRGCAKKKEGAHLLCAFFFFPPPYSPGNLLAVFRIQLITHQAPFA